MVSRTENVSLPFESKMASAAGVGSTSKLAEAGTISSSSRDKLNPFGAGLVAAVLTGIEEADSPSVTAASGISVAGVIESANFSAPVCG